MLRFPLLCLITSVLLVTECFAEAPRLELSGEVQGNGETVSFDLVPLDSVYGCHYAYFADRNYRRISQDPTSAYQIATFQRSTRPVDMIAENLKPLIRGKGKRGVRSARVYFRMQVVCGEEIGYSDIVTLEVQRKRRGRGTASIRRWILQIKKKIREDN